MRVGYFERGNTAYYVVPGVTRTPLLVSIDRNSWGAQVRLLRKLPTHTLAWSALQDWERAAIRWGMSLGLRTGERADRDRPLQWTTRGSPGIHFVHWPDQVGQYSLTRIHTLVKESLAQAAQVFQWTPPPLLLVLGGASRDAVGSARVGKKSNRIILSRKLFARYNEQVVRDTILHEITHLYRETLRTPVDGADRERAHDEVFCRLLSKLVPSVAGNRKLCMYSTESDDPEAFAARTKRQGAPKWNAQDGWLRIDTARNAMLWRPRGKNRWVPTEMPFTDIDLAEFVARFDPGDLLRVEVEVVGDERSRMRDWIRTRIVPNAPRLPRTVEMLVRRGLLERS